MVRKFEITNTLIIRNTGNTGIDSQWDADVGFTLSHCVTYGNDPDGTFAPIQAVINLQESFVDDYTGEPVMADMRDLVVTTHASMRLMEDALGVLNITRGADTDATRTSVVRPAAGIFAPSSSRITPANV